MSVWGNLKFDFDETSYKGTVSAQIKTSDVARYAADNGISFDAARLKVLAAFRSYVNEIIANAQVRT